ncbi:putative transcriptional regulatory protein NarL [Baekduia alba]|uniref:response regulator transcription factor n=1 Tax=Baekduia alba TaxID=2997333 RepID=UPI00233FE6B5|nr:response regulator transcription factor [Baekduia alba]WCB92181.1 putative transcriptional regulatory protein NarL [Baekduia alba]
MSIPALDPDAPPPRRLSVLVVDDHDIVHWGMRLVLVQQDWVERCVPATTGDEAEDRARRYGPHVALVDLFVGDESGTDIARRVRAAHPATRVLLVSGAGRISATAARAAGAAGFVTKDRSAADIVEAIRRVGAGEDVFDAAGAAAGNLRASTGDGRPGHHRLTNRERQVLQQIAGGLTNAEIAAELKLSPNTVKEHASSMFKKLGARNRADAVQRAQRLGVLG